MRRHGDLMRAFLRQPRAARAGGAGTLAGQRRALLIGGAGRIVRIELALDKERATASVFAFRADAHRSLTLLTDEARICRITAACDPGSWRFVERFPDE